jgi:hypothetical protein
MARQGDIIYLRGGRYTPTTSIQIRKSGTAQQPILLQAYPGEKVIVDGSRASDEKDGLLFLNNANYWYVKGISFQYSSAPTNWAMLGIVLYGKSTHNTFDSVEVSYMDGPGLGIYGQSSYNLVINSSSHHNYDKKANGGNADGFQAAGTADTSREPTGNVFIQTVAYNNSDDGFDMWKAYANEVYNSKAYHNGYRQDGVTRAGDGNGFKLGRGLGGHTVMNSVAYDNPLNGFDNNGATGPMKIINNTAHDNGYGFSFPHNSGSVFTGNLSYNSHRAELADARNLGSNNSWNPGVDRTKVGACISAP